MVELKCPRCQHAWDYKGTYKPGQRACCPACGSRVGIPKVKEEAA